MNSSQHIPADDLALFAMQFLPPEEQAQIRLHLQYCSECRRELGNIQGDLATFAMTAEMHTPPSLARQRLLKQVGREKKFIPPPEPAIQRQVPQGASSFTFGGVSTSRYDEEEAPKRGVGAWIFGGVGWAAAAACAFGAFHLYQEREDIKTNLRATIAQMETLNSEAAHARQVLDALTDRSAKRVTLNNPKTPTGRVIYNAEKGSLIFIASNLEPLQPQKAYELWIIPYSGAPIPAGVFKTDSSGGATLILPDVPKGVQAKVFGVTIEDEHGSATPTQPIIMAGE